MKNQTLSRPAREWFDRLRAAHRISEAGPLELLQSAAESWDRIREARRLLADEGLVTLDRFGQRVPHPAIRIETSARAQMLQALKQLGIPAGKAVGRPAQASTTAVARMFVES
jgi:phage terminase small subunit